MTRTIGFCLHLLVDHSKQHPDTCLLIYPFVYLFTWRACFVFFEVGADCELFRVKSPMSVAWTSVGAHIMYWCVIMYGHHFLKFKIH